MSRVVLLHGMPDREEYFSEEYPSGSNSHWFPWLQKQLIIRGHDVQTPEVLNAFKPEYDVWKAEFERHLVEEPMILVGHSCGAGFLVRWVSENPDAPVSKLILVAPWLDPARAETTDFFDFLIDPHLHERIDEIHLFHSSDDFESVRVSVEMLREQLPSCIDHHYDSMGHFTLSSVGTVAFPDLLTVTA